MVGENNSSESGAITYDCVEFEDYLGNVGLNDGVIWVPLPRIWGMSVKLTHDQIETLPGSSYSKLLVGLSQIISPYSL